MKVLITSLSTLQRLKLTNQTWVFRVTPIDNVMVTRRWPWRERTSTVTMAVVKKNQLLESKIVKKSGAFAPAWLYTFKRHVAIPGRRKWRPNFTRFIYMKHKYVEDLCRIITLTLYVGRDPQNIIPGILWNNRRTVSISPTTNANVRAGMVDPQNHTVTHKKTSRGTNRGIVKEPKWRGASSPISHFKNIPLFM